VGYCISYRLWFWNNTLIIPEKTSFPWSSGPQPIDYSHVIEPALVLTAFLNGDVRCILGKIRKTIVLSWNLNPMLHLIKLPSFHW
jgi:hypothetical protein